MANTARYWRVQHMSIGSTLGDQGQFSTANMYLEELRFYALSTDTVPLSGTYSFEANWLATSRLNDGDLTESTFNRNNGANVWIAFDAGSATTIGKIELVAPAGNVSSTPVRWVLQWSPDGVVWVDAGVLVVETTPWATPNESRSYTVSPVVVAQAIVPTQRVYVVSEPDTPERAVVHTQRVYAVSSPVNLELANVSAQRAYVVSVPPANGGLAHPAAAAAPEYAVENLTPYVKFEPETNNKQLWFYPETNGTYKIIALRPNLTSFFESEQAFSGPDQIKVPHFNQLFLTDRDIDAAERAGIKAAMQGRAAGTGIDVEFFDAPYHLSITNPGAETGDTTGWTTSGRFSVDTGSVGDTPGAYEGTYYFYGGDSTAASAAFQDVDVSARSSDIDAGSAGVMVNWQQSHFDGSDTGNIKLEFFSAVDLTTEDPWLLDTSFVRAGLTIDATQTEITNTSGGTDYLWWVPTLNTLSTSDNTRYYWEVQMGGGATQYNGYHGIVTQAAVDSIATTENNFDNIDASIGRRGNGTIWENGGQRVSGLRTFGAGKVLMMLFNPSTGQVWTGVDGIWDNDPSGSATFTMNTSGQSVYYVGLQARNQGDGQKLLSATSDLIYGAPAGTSALGGGSIELTGSDPGPGLSAHAGGWLTRTTGEVALPPGTRTVRVIMEAQRVSGSNNNAYFDAIEGSVIVRTPVSGSVEGGLKDPYIPGFVGVPPA